MTDQQRGDLALPDHPLVLPNLRRFASEGVRFGNAWCPSPHCCPSRASFFTGLYPSQHGIWNNVLVEQALRTALHPGVRMWSEDLAAAGYDLNYTGKWHVSGEERPRDRGWKELAGVTEVPGAGNLTPWSLYDELAEQPCTPGRQQGQIVRPGWPKIDVYGTLPDGAFDRDEFRTQTAIDCLKSKKGQNQPWALYVGLVAPHDPYFARKEFIDQTPLNPPFPVSFRDDLKGRPGIYRRLREQIFGQLSDDEWRQVIRHYWACCLQVDEAFGRILAALEESGHADNTLVLFCSDHGDYMGDHGLLCKGVACYSSAYHIPSIIRWPKRLRNPGRDVDAFVSLTDFAPTFLAAAGITEDRPFVGQSLLPFIDDQPSPVGWRDAVFTQCNGVELYYTQRSVRTLDWLYVFNGFDCDELYNLRLDPHQMENLAANPDFSPIVQEMCARLWRFARSARDTIINPYWTVGLAPFGPATAFSGEAVPLTSSVCASSLAPS